MIFSCGVLAETWSQMGVEHHFTLIVVALVMTYYVNPPIPIIGVIRF